MKFPVIMGPTASGKSGLALAFAEKFGGEILSMDSMQVYRGLDRGTAKPSPEERKRIPHHLIDILDLTEKADLFTFTERACSLTDQLKSQRVLPILAGGTGLYLRSFLYGLDSMPADPELRAFLDRQYDSTEGFEELKKITEREMPLDYARWKEHRRHLIRAREVFLLSGKQMEELTSAWKSRPPRPDAVSFVLVWDREKLRERIRIRCGKMLNSGWIEETEHLMKQGLFSTPTARQALGYSLIRDMLEGKIPRSELQDRITTATWQFARRQMTWFRGQHPEAHLLPLPCPEDKLLEQIFRLTK